MKIDSARQAWHDCTYNQSASGLGRLEQILLLGRTVQTSACPVNANAAVHAAMSGWVQLAIAQLPLPLQAFGNYMYSPVLEATCTASTCKAAEAVVLDAVLALAPRMTAAKREKLELVVKGVMRRYRHMHQGGQSSASDPCATAEQFRRWLSDHYDMRLASSNWARNWGTLERLIFDCCADIDQRALATVSAAIQLMNEDI